MGPNGVVEEKGLAQASRRAILAFIYHPHGKQIASGEEEKAAEGRLSGGMARNIACHSSFFPIRLKARPCGLTLRETGGNGQVFNRMVYAAGSLGFRPKLD